MEFKKLMTAVALMGAMTFGAATASAQFNYIGEVNTALGSNLNTTSDCIVCHSGASNSGGDKGVTPFASDWSSLASAASGTLTTADQVLLAAKDSDGDGTVNSIEGAAGTDFWGVVPAATGTDSAGGCVTASVTTPLMMLLGMLTLGFFVRRKKD